MNIIQQLLFICITITAISTQPLQILMLTNKFPHSARMYINNQIAGLLDLGHEVYILTKQSHEEYYNCPIFEQYNLKEKTYYNTLPNNLRKFDIIYAQFGDMGLWALELINNQYIQGSLVVSFRGKDAIYNPYGDINKYNGLFEKASLCLPVCEFFKKNLMLYGCPESKIEVLYSGVDLNNFPYKNRIHTNNEIFKIISVSRLHASKGHLNTLKVIAEVKKQYPQIKLYIIGSGPKKRIIEKRIKKLDLKNEVALLGYQSHNEILTKLHESDLFLYTPLAPRPDSERDGIANVLKESLLTGLPVVTTEHGGNSEIIKNGVTGFIFPTKKLYKLTRYILYLIKHPEKRKIMGMNGSNLIRNYFDRDVLNQKMIELFNKIIQNKNL